MVNAQETCTADRNTDVHSCSTHGPADEEHGDGSDQRYVPDQRLQDHTQLPVQLRQTKKLEGGLNNDVLSHFNL